MTDEDKILLGAQIGGLLGVVAVGVALLAKGDQPPLTELKVTSAYGPRKGHTHNGVDIRAPIGTPIRAPWPGTVGVWQSDRAGRALTLSPPGKITLRLMHLSAYSVPDGAEVDAGDLLGLSGDTGLGPDGRRVPPHIHLEVLKEGRPVDPRLAFPDWPWA